MYTMRFWFEHGGGCLWSADPYTKEIYGYKVPLKQLPLSASLMEQLQELEQHYRTYLDWENPGAGCQWSDEEMRAFFEAATAAYSDLCVQLGEAYSIENALQFSTEEG